MNAESSSGEPSQPWVRFEESERSLPGPAGSGPLVLVSQALIVRPPFITGGLIWNRPVAVRTTAGGAEKTIPVVDITRIILLLLLGLGLAGVTIARLLATGRR